MRSEIAADRWQGFASSGFFSVFFVPSVLKAFQDLTQRGLRKTTESTEKPRASGF
jgi:hypothetical protein